MSEHLFEIDVNNYGVELTIASPMGLFAPGFKNLGDYLQNMWKDAEANREKWGCEYLVAIEILSVAEHLW